jgi:hypothetical protein
MTALIGFIVSTVDSPRMTSIISLPVSHSQYIIKIGKKIQIRYGPIGPIDMSKRLHYMRIISWSCSDLPLSEDGNAVIAIRFNRLEYQHTARGRDQTVAVATQKGTVMELAKPWLPLLPDNKLENFTIELEQIDGGENVLKDWNAANSFFCIQVAPENLIGSL